MPADQFSIDQAAVQAGGDVASQLGEIEAPVLWSSRLSVPKTSSRDGFGFGRLNSLFLRQNSLLHRNNSLFR